MAILEKMAKMVNGAKISPILPTKFLVIEGPNTCDQIEFYVFHSCLLEVLKNAGYIPVPAVYVLYQPGDLGY